MHPHVTFGMILRRLLHSVEPVNLRQHLPEQSRSVEQLECPRRMTFSKHARQFIADAFTADPRNSRGVGANGRLSLRLDVKFKSRRKADSAQHPEPVFGKAPVGIANRA